MKVLVTGGTGFIGSHITAALLGRGHDVRLLVRRPEQVMRTFGPLGIPEEQLGDQVVGDVRDSDAIARAMAGCEAVVHAAAIFSVDARRREEVLNTNEKAAEVVLGTAVRLGMDPIVHISSTVALTRMDGTTDASLPLGDLRAPYTVSKRRSEEIARAYQEAGAPLVTVYPGGTFGPHDPYLGDQNERLRWIARGLFPLWPSGGYHVTDVRTVAAVVAAVLKPGRGARRYVVPGHHMRAADLFGGLRAATGRRYPHVVIPKAIVMPMTASMDLVQKRLPRSWRYPSDHDGTELSVADARLDDSAARLDLGVTPPELADTLRDTVAWMAGAGHLTRRQAGRALAAHSAQQERHEQDQRH